jgi:hypothetical protein
VLLLGVSPTCTVHTFIGLLTAVSMVACIYAIVGGVVMTLAVRSLLDAPMPVARVRRHRLPGLVEVSRSARPWVVSWIRRRIASRVTKLSEVVTSPIGRARSSP